MQEVVSEMQWLFALVSCMVAIYTTWMYKEIRIRNQELIERHAQLYYRYCDLEIEKDKYKACCDTAHYGMEAICRGKGD